MKFHHLGMAVKKPDKCIHFLSALGYIIGDVVYDRLQSVNLIMCTSNKQPNVEIVFPGTGPSPIDNILQNHDQLIYHTCYEVSSIDSYISKLKSHSVRLIQISPATPAILFGGRNVAFFMVHGFGVIELLEESDESLSR